MTYVTNSTLSETELLGSQCTEYFCLMVVARNTGKRCVVTSKYVKNKMGTLMFDCFDNPLPIMTDILPAKSVPMDHALNGLDPDKSYDFTMVHKPMTKFIKSTEDIALIRERFRFRYHFIEYAREVVSAVRETFRLPVASVHFRDYKDVPPHLILSREYYHAAIGRLLKSVGKCSLLMFSNNLPRLRKMAIGKTAGMVEFYPDQSDMVEMAIMSLCDHNIIGNSTFSAIPAILNELGGMVVCPWKWVSDDYDRAQRHPVNGCWFLPHWTAIKET